MVLAFTRDNTTIEDLVQLADRVVEVAVPPCLQSIHTLSELDKLRTEFATLTQVVNSLQTEYCTRPSSDCCCSPNPAHQPCPPSDLCWYH